MPRHAKGARAYLQPERKNAAGEVIEASVWVIRDGTRKRSTGILGDDARDASDERIQKALRAFLGEKHDPAPGPRHPSQVEVADVLNMYVRNKLSSLADIKEAARRIKLLIAFWGDKKLSEVNGVSCRLYIDERGKPPAARRELEDLRAAINHHRKEGLCSEIVSVVLPEKATERDRWLTRSEAAALIWSAYRYREKQKGKETDRRSRRHVARFILLALYTGSRSGVICGAAMQPTTGRGFVDLERGVFYRKEPGAKKTNKRAPPIRIPDRLLAHMRRWKRIGVSNNSVIEWNGAPVGSVRKALARAAEDAKIPEVTPHVFRHTAATWGMQNGADPWELSGLLGMTIETLIRVYGHHSPDHQKGAADALTGRTRQKPDRNDVNANRTSAGMENVKRLNSAVSR